MTDANITCHLTAKLGEVMEATLQVAPNRSEAYFMLMSFVLMSLCANVTKPSKPQISSALT